MVNVNVIIKHSLIKSDKIFTTVINGYGTGVLSTSPIYITELKIEKVRNHPTKNVMRGNPLVRILEDLDV